MSAALLGSQIIEGKLKDLCEAILADPTYRHHIGKVEHFMGDESARQDYRETTELGQSLQQKRRNGESLDPIEIANFESRRDLLVANPVVRDFLDAQQTLGDLPAVAGSWVRMTIELGRLPEESDFETGCCGGHDHDHDHCDGSGHGHGGCGCSH